MKQAGLIAVALMLALETPTRAQRSLDDAFRTFWRAADSGQAAAAAESIVKLTPAFDDAFQRLRKGRSYLPDVPKGVVRGSHDMAGRSFAYSLDVPHTYDPNVRYQVRFQLHGGVGRPEPALRGAGSIGALAGAEQIYVLPDAWDDAPWWSGAQVENLRDDPRQGEARLQRRREPRRRVRRVGRRHRRVLRRDARHDAVRRASCR